jgi:hypothetical protein
MGTTGASIADRAASGARSAIPEMLTAARIRTRRTMFIADQR